MSLPYYTRKSNPTGPYLLIAIDIGTTQTAATYSIVDPARSDNKFQEVNRWPEQGLSDAKIPSTIYFDNSNTPQLQGAATEDEDSLLNAERFGWRKVEWWKLHLRPSYLPLPLEDLSAQINIDSHQSNTLAELPPNLTVDDIFKHQLTYVLCQTYKQIEKAHGISGEEFGRLEEGVSIILTVPNGWEGREHNRMRMALINTGIFDNIGRNESSSPGVMPVVASLTAKEKRERVRVVSEGEAAIHYAMDNIDPSRSHSFKLNSVILVCDAGGGTTDIGSYKIKGLDPIILHEMASPKCIIAGATFVNYAARSYIENQLRDTDWDNETCLTTALREFERGAKRKFKGSEQLAVRLDSSSKSNFNRGITRGRLQIPSEKMKSFFDPLVNEIINGLTESLAVLPKGMSVDHIVLVGGFAESNYVFSQIHTWATDNCLSLAKPDNAMSKAVTYGALKWHLTNGVQSRVAKFHYGAETDGPYNPGSNEMQGRKTYFNPKGEQRVRDVFHSIVPKDTRLVLRGRFEHSAKFFRVVAEDGSDLPTVDLDLYAYRWKEPPTFYKNKDGNLVDGFVSLGTVTADLTYCFAAANTRVSPNGKKYRVLDYEIGLVFDQVEVEAKLRWKENNRWVYGEALIVYDI